MRQTELRLTKQERRAVDAFRSKGAHMAREFNRAHILAALDRKVPEREIMEVLGVGRTAIWRTRAAYLEGGPEFALQDVARPGQPKRYGTDNAMNRSCTWIRQQTYSRVFHRRCGRCRCSQDATCVWPTPWPVSRGR